MSSTKSKFKKADAFLNLCIVDKQGNEHWFHKGKPMYSSSKVDRSLIAKASATDENEYELELKGVVRLANDDNTEVFEL